MWTARDVTALLTEQQHASAEFWEWCKEVNLNEACLTIELAAVHNIRGMLKKYPSKKVQIDGGLIAKCLVIPNTELV